MVQVERGGDVIPKIVAVVESGGASAGEKGGEIMFPADVRSAAARW